jgi:hypothetical protein
MVGFSYLDLIDENRNLNINCWNDIYVTPDLPQDD